MDEQIKHQVVTNNPIVKDSGWSNTFEIIFIDADVAEVLNHCLLMLDQKDMKLETDIMGGRRVRAYPFITLFLRARKVYESNKNDFVRILDYIALDSARKVQYAEYNKSLVYDYMCLDFSLSETAYRSLLR